MPYLAGFITPQDYGAVGNGTADDTLPIQNALNAAPLGGVVYLPPGTYGISSPLYIPPQVTLWGSHSSHIDSTTCCIKALASFSSSNPAMILMVDQATGGYSVASNQQGLFFVTLDGSAITGSTTDGLQMQGFVHGVIVQDVQIRSMPNHFISSVSNGSGFSYSHRFTRVLGNNCGGYGYSAGGMTDTTWIDVESIGSSKSGFLLNAQPSNSVFIGCRSEYSNWNGFEISGTWTGSNTGGGGCQLIGCSTDGSNRNGILITATGDTPLSIIGGYYRRDGANGIAGGGSYAGIQCTGSTIPVEITQPTVLTGLANAGIGQSVPGPQYGFAVNASSSNVVVSGGMLYGNTQAWIDDATNTNILRGANVIERVGGQTGYSTAFHGLQSSLSALDFQGHTVGLPTPFESGMVAWSHDPAFTSQSSGDTMTSGVIYLAAVYVQRATSITKIYWGVGTAAATPTAGENFIMLINAAGTVLASVSIDTNVAGTGGQTSTISSTAVTPGLYWVGILQNATTPAKLYRASNANGTVANLGPNAAATKRFATNGSGLIAAPVSITPSSNVTSALAITVGIS